MAFVAGAATILLRKTIHNSERKEAFAKAKAMVIIMKAFISSCIVLLIIISLSLFLSMKVTGICDEIYSLAAQLPDDPKSQQAFEGVSQIDKIWKENYDIFNLTLNRELILSIDICLSNLHSVIMSGEQTDYLSHVKVLRATIEGITSLERPGFVSIL